MKRIPTISIPFILAPALLFLAIYRVNYLHSPSAAVNAMFDAMKRKDEQALIHLSTPIAFSRLKEFPRQCRRSEGLPWLDSWERWAIREDSKAKITNFGFPGRFSVINLDDAGFEFQRTSKGWKISGVGYGTNY